jgi:hypothetical protein
MGQSLHHPIELVVDGFTELFDMQDFATQPIEVAGRLDYSESIPMERDFPAFYDFQVTVCLFF